MNGHSIKEKIGEISWVDSELMGLAIDYDDVVITIEHHSTQEFQLILNGYIGYQQIGMWDEMIISSIKYHEAHNFIDQCVEHLVIKGSSKLTDSGNSYRNKSRWFLVEIELIDNCFIFVVAGGGELNT